MRQTDSAMPERSKASRPRRKCINTVDECAIEIEQERWHKIVTISLGSLSHVQAWPTTCSLQVLFNFRQHVRPNLLNLSTRMFCPSEHLNRLISRSGAKVRGRLASRRRSRK